MVAPFGEAAGWVAGRDAMRDVWKVVPLAVMLIALAAGHAAAQGRRVAMVIGNNAYRNVPALINPDNDARLMARTLQDLGFTLVGGAALLNLDKAAFDRAVQQFGQAIAGADVSLFYYSGHGMQVDGDNWLVPIDANPARKQDLDFQMVNAALVLRQMEGAGAKLNVLILDACRNNPFAGSAFRGARGGLTAMQAPEGTVISYATQPGNVAADGGGSNSPFTLALSRTMRQPGLDALNMFNRVGVEVKKMTGGQQQPWVANSPIDGTFYFNGAGPPAPVLPAASVDPEPSRTPSAPRPVPPLPPVPAPPPSAPPPDPVRILEGRWRYPDGRACSDDRVGVVSVANGRLRFEWRLGRGRPNIAIERIDRVEGNVITTTVEEDLNTPTPETMQRQRYVVARDSWTSENLSTRRGARHDRC